MIMRLHRLLVHIFLCHHTCMLFFIKTSAIKFQRRVPVQIHVRVAEQTLGHSLHVPRHLIGQLRRGHVQVLSHLGTGLDHGDVISIQPP